MESERQKQIHDMGFSVSDGPATEYGKIKVGLKTLDDAVLNLNSIKNKGCTYYDKQTILTALSNNELATLREISKYYYRTNGIYQRACNYFATTYRYDWYVVPEILDDKVPEEKVLKDFSKVLAYLDNSYIRKICADMALSVIVKGAYYGYVTSDDDKIMLQELPVSYCRTRYSVGNLPAVEFNMRFFDDKFADIGYRMRVLKMFPEEFQKGYILYKQGKLVPDFAGDMYGSWYLLDPEKTVKFSFNNGDLPLFINALPAILDLDAAQELDRRKQMQKLLKILVQKLPRDKNGDLIFDVDEARDIHNNAVDMLRRAVGVDVLTTFADVESINISDNNTTTKTDDLEKMERTVFNSLGISQNLFNTEGNLSLEKSILEDEGSIRTLLLQFEIFFDRMVQTRNSARKKYNFRLYMLSTTQYNYQTLAKMYKEQVQIGYSKMLPQIAMGHSQSSILNTAFFENNVLHLSAIMIPPLMSSVMNGEDILGNRGQSTTSKIQDITEESEVGRPAKDEGEKSDKTLMNEESMS